MQHMMPALQVMAAAGLSNSTSSSMAWWPVTAVAVLLGIRMTQDLGARQGDGNTREPSAKVRSMGH